jgi:hypothetical protein
VIIFSLIATLTLVGVAVVIWLMFREPSVEPPGAATPAHLNSDVGGGLDEMSPQSVDDWMNNYGDEAQQDDVSEDGASSTFVQKIMSRFGAAQPSIKDEADIPQASEFPELKEKIIDNSELNVEQKPQSQEVTDPADPSDPSESSSAVFRESSNIEQQTPGVNPAELERLNQLLRDQGQELQKLKTDLNHEQSHRKDFEKVKHLLDEEILSLKSKLKDAKSALDAQSAEFEAFKSEAKIWQERAQTLEQIVERKEHTTDSADGSQPSDSFTADSAGEVDSKSENKSQNFSIRGPSELMEDSDSKSRTADVTETGDVKPMQSDEGNFDDGHEDVQIDETRKEDTP